MSVANHYVISTATTSDSSNHNNYNHDSTIVQYDDTILDLPRSTVNEKSNIVNLQEQQRTHVLHDAAKIDQMLLSEMSAITAATAPTEAASSTYQQLQAQMQQQKHIIHYPADFMQLGKRKFQSLESSQSNDKCQPPLQNFTFSNTTSSQTNHNNLDNEAGLSLLFAASLLQQQQQSCQSNNIVVDKKVSSDTKPIINSESALKWEQHQHKKIRGAYQHYGMRSIIDERKESLEGMLNDTQVFDKIEDGAVIEPRANDGTLFG
jgi:hypothetical protein